MEEKKKEIKQKKQGSGRPLAFLLLYALATTFLIAVAGVWYTNHEISVNNQKFCELLQTIDNPIPPPSNNPRQVDGAIKIHNLRINLGC